MAGNTQLQNMQAKLSLTCLPKTWGLEQDYWQSLSYLPSTARAGSDEINAKVHDGRHKQCQKLGGSRYADLTTPQGVTQFIEIKQIPSNPYPEGGSVGKLNKFVTKCTRLIET